MKTAIFTLTFLALASQAQASFFQIQCSNADGTVLTASGQNENYVQVTRFVNGKRRPVKDENGLLEVQTRLDGKVLVDDAREGACDSGGFRWVTLRRVTAAEVSIARADGSAFAADTFHVSQDRKTVSTVLVCEQLVSNTAPCAR